MAVARTPIADRFWPKVDCSGGPESCWLWKAATKQGGYGKIGAEDWREGPKLAHRVSWEISNGAIPEGMAVLHRCDVPGCVNPAHLFLGTQADNMADMRRKRRDCRGEAMRSALRSSAAFQNRPASSQFRPHDKATGRFVK